jgi:hypothetical protein
MHILRRHQHARRGFELAIGRERHPEGIEIVIVWFHDGFEGLG